VGINHRFRGAAFPRQYSTAYSNDAKPLNVLNDFAFCNNGGNITEWSMAGKRQLLQDYLDKHGGCVAATLHAFKQSGAIWAATSGKEGEAEIAAKVEADAAAAGQSQERAGAARVDFSAYPREGGAPAPKIMKATTKAAAPQPDPPKSTLSIGAKAPPMRLQAQGRPHWGWLLETESALRAKKRGKGQSDSDCEQKAVHSTSPCQD
jgi:hypothetical protein